MSAPARSSADVVVVGGGIAGLSVAVALAGRARVRLLEREPLLASHASGNNAAIYRPLEHDQTSAWLAQRSGELLGELGQPDLLRRTGLLLASSDESRVRALAEHAHAQHVACSIMPREELSLLEPTLDGGEIESALLLHDGGVLDIHALTTALANVARQRGVIIDSHVEVARVRVADAKVQGVELRDGTRVEAAHVVLAAGAWGAELGRSCGAELALTPTRRHLVVLRANDVPSARRPVVWRLEDEIYYRPESGGFLASPCDETPWRAEVPANDPSALVMLAQKLARIAPRLAGQCVVQRSWACLRTFTPDREIAAGPDPRVDGLHWLGALGGRGMSIAPAAGEIVAQKLLGGPVHPSAASFDVLRLLSAVHASG